MKDMVLKLAERIRRTMDSVATEEATKTAFVMPFLQALGYDVFNPLEVVPEYVADVGLKKGEKVDYAICRDGVPALLVECKSCGSELSLNNESQLLRYYHTSKAEFGILTNGIIYKFYTDLEAANKMDMMPFMEINLLEPDKIKFAELEKFSKANFDAANIRRSADNLKCANAIKLAVAAEFEAPSPDFVRLLFRSSGIGQVFNDKARERLTPIVKAVIDTIINDKVKNSLSSALDVTVKDAEAIAAANDSRSDSGDDGIITTDDELEAYNIIRAIASEDTAVENIVLRDAKTYCAILFANNNRKPVARLYFNNPAKLQIGLFDGEAEEKFRLEKLSDLFSFRERIRACVKKYFE